MRWIASRRNTDLLTTSLLAAVLANLCFAWGISFHPASSSPNDEFLSSATNRSQSRALTNSRDQLRLHIAKQKHVRNGVQHLAASVAAVRLTTNTLVQQVSESDSLRLYSSFFVRPRGRAPPLSV